MRGFGMRSFGMRGFGLRGSGILGDSDAGWAAGGVGGRYSTSAEACSCVAAQEASTRSASAVGEPAGAV